MKKLEKVRFVLRTLLALLLCAVFTLTASAMAEEPIKVLISVEVPASQAEPQIQSVMLSPEAPAAEPLTEYWSAGSAVAESLRSYVSKVTNPGDPANFIPVKDRIAVFDMDGTLTCETFFTYISM